MATLHVYEDQRPNWPYESWTEKYEEQENDREEGNEEALPDRVELTETHRHSKTEVNPLPTENETENETRSAQEDNLAGTLRDETKEDEEAVYEPDHWSDELEANTSESCPINTLIRATASPVVSETAEGLQISVETKEDEEAVYEPDHWSDELEADTSESCPINTLIRATASPVISETAEGLQMRDVIMPMLKATLTDLIVLYKLFHGSFLLPVGSMAENTKVGKADEFDFAVILPVLAQKEYLGLLDKVGEVVTDPAILSLLGDIWEGNMDTAANSFQELLRELWSMKMMEHVPEGWRVLNPSGHSDAHSVAATFHLQQELDKTLVDLDVCFWVPLDKESLLEIKFPRRHYLSKHCLDEHGFVYVVLLQDNNILLEINSVRFAMSVIEKYALNKYGTDNGRLQCYRTCKCLVSALLPKMKKQQECDFCFDGLVSSYCLKNIVLYMAANHTDDAYWTKEKLPNRVLEVFVILTFCMKVNACNISAYFTPYQLSLDSTLKYDPSTKCVTDSEANWYDSRDIPCVLPDLTQIKEQFTEDPISQTAVSDYEKFLSSTEWRYPEVICRVTELLTNIMQEDEEDRKELVEDTGWNYIGLSLPACECYVVSVDTKL